MKKHLLLTVFLGAFSHLMASVSFSVYNLTCEQEENPLGIETPIPHFSWKIQSQARGFQQVAYQIIVSDNETQLARNKGNIWESGKVYSSESILIPFAGTLLKAGTTYFWKIRIWNQDKKVSEWSSPQRFTMGLLTASDWKGAKWIALEVDQQASLRIPALIAGRDELPDNPYKNPQFRREFQVRKGLKKALAYISGLGHFEMLLNGEKVGTNFMDPGWTKYDQSILYVSFDVTSQLETGSNVCAVRLGGGFYRMPAERYLKIYNAFGMPKMKLCLQMEYTDGSREWLVSDENWKTMESAITFSSIYGGENYEATREETGWWLTGFDDRHWNTPILAENPTPMYSQRSPALSIRKELPVMRQWKNERGNWVYDFGQNFSGIPRICVKSMDPKPIQMIPGELLHPDGTVNQFTSGAPFWFSFTPSGSLETERWEPRFTYYGFRYLEIQGAVPSGQENPDLLPEIEEITGLHTSNSATEVGRFTCSKPIFNQTHELIDWAMRSNMASVLTDCPHREKLGWLEQAYLMQHSLQYRYNLARLYEKIMEDMSQAQTPEGVIPTIAPEYVRFDSGFEDTPEWGSAFIVCPWNIYEWYGDKRLIVKYYPQMKKYMDYLRSRAENHILSYGLGDWYDLGPNPPGYAQLTSNGVTATATFYNNAILLQKMASLLGNEKDENYYKEMATQIKGAFNARFFHKESQIYDRNSQTANAMALCFDLVEPEYKAQVLKNLVEDIRQRDFGLTAGDVGYRYLLKALEANGCEEIIYKMNSRYHVPGYGYQIAQGATALTESWNALRTSSNNHFMLGHLMEWLYSGLGGIRQEEGSVGFRKIRIEPQLVGDITHAQTSYESPYGLIRCEWIKKEEDYLIHIEVPANCEAVVYLPVLEGGVITESGLSLENTTGIQHVKKETDKISIQIGSGNYRFLYSNKENA